MLNCSEELSYWYLRLNGFFLIDNFVIHKSKNIEYSSDADIIGVRTPFVFEAIGGQADDWDENLFRHFDTDALIGIICQVKGGALDDKPLFNESYLSYSVQRLGLSSKVDKIISQLNQSPVVIVKNELDQKCQFAKLLITRDKPIKDINYLWFSLDNVYSFIKQRIEKYPKEKYRDRNYFGSTGIQYLIEINALEMIRQKESNL